MLLDATISPDDSMVVAAGAGGQLWFWDTRSGTLMWTLTGHKTYISAVHFEGKALISRGFYGDLARWELPPASPVGSSIARFERLVRCGPLRFDEATGTLVTQPPSCPGPQQ